MSSFSDRFEDNVGMKDIVCALRWVRDNIEAFGGDKDNVTLWGQSAGAGAISTLLMIDEAQGLYHKIIMQSNCFGSYYTPEEAGYMALKFMKLSGVNPASPEGIMALSYDEVNSALKKLQDHVYSIDNKEGNPGKCIFCPLVDGDYIKGYPTLSDYTGKGIPMLIGSNRFRIWKLSA